jgi:hypothetical protein
LNKLIKTKIDSKNFKDITMGNQQETKKIKNKLLRKIK